MASKDYATLTSAMPARFFSDLGCVLLFWAVLGGGSASFQHFYSKAPFGPLAGEDRPEVLEEVDFDQMQRVNGAEATVVDTRARDRYRAGHVPGAVSWPRFGTAEIPAAIGTLSRSRRLIVYCSGVACEDAEVVARRLRALGFTRVGIYRGGWEEWTENGGAVER